MGYFRELPNINYPSPLNVKNSSGDFVIIKNIFRSTKLLDWLSANVMLFNKSIISDGARPEMVAEDYYGDPDLDFIVIISAGITNITNQWPLSSQDLWQFIDEKYGASKTEVHHYETLEVRDDKNRLILPAGQQVNASINTTHLDSLIDFEGNTIHTKFTIDGPARYKTTKENVGKVWKVLYRNQVNYVPENVEHISPYVAITNEEYEQRINEDKREIDLLRPQYVQQFLNDFRRIMKYDRNTQYINDYLINTENNKFIN
tara:strand:- start:336 stop:1115 length:780 start_codon:yes stop_codon:yes gene_type:complete